MEEGEGPSPISPPNHMCPAKLSWVQQRTKTSPTGLAFASYLKSHLEQCREQIWQIQNDNKTHRKLTFKELTGISPGQSISERAATLKSINRISFLDSPEHSLGYSFSNFSGPSISSWGLTKTLTAKPHHPRVSDSAGLRWSLRMFSSIIPGRTLREPWPRQNRWPDSSKVKNGKLFL